MWTQNLKSDIIFYETFSRGALEMRLILCFHIYEFIETCATAQAKLIIKIFVAASDEPIL